MLINEEKAPSTMQQICVKCDSVLWELFSNLKCDECPYNSPGRAQLDGVKYFCLVRHSESGGCGCLLARCIKCGNVFLPVWFVRPQTREVWSSELCHSRQMKGGES
jgi:hypothetical protein